MSAHPIGPAASAQGVAPAAVPVFNCVVHVAPRNADGIVAARVANLAGIEGRGGSEREALSQAVAAFKTAVASYHARGEPIPFIADSARPAPGEIERLIAVHL